MITRSFGLEGHVALVDDGAHRVVLLTPHSTPRDPSAPSAGTSVEIERRSLTVGKSVVAAAPSADGKRLFVLSLGDITRKKESDERASLTLIEDGVAKRFPLESPHSGLAIDPRGRWVALYAAPDQGQRTFVENPNEIVLIDLAAPLESAVTPRTLRSFGGRPQRLSFTEPLGLPSGPRRLLVVETDQDVALLDLDNVRAVPQRPEVTVRLTSGATALQARPAGIAVDDGDPSNPGDTRIGIRLANGTSVVTLTLVPTPEGTKAEDPLQVPNDFSTEVNLTDVGGVPGDITFVRTDVGLRLAAIVPTTKKAVLVDPQTSLVTEVDLPEPYARISLITNVISGAGGTDTALLYGAGGARGVAFWSLGRATGKPYRSVEVVSLQAGISSVLDVPPPRPELKVLGGQGTNAFYVLNLASRTASPLTTLGSATLHLSRDGQRLWAFERGRPSLAQVALGDLHPIPLPLDRPIDAVFETATAEGGRALIALDARGAAGVTVLDALAPDTATSRSYYGLLLEDL
ncbi:MAG: hypothetical protein JST00_41530 [Deltaproteobacteria bacterium]|nr:hypothetical protein [Deltaproteobacteria bacterium]